MMKINLLPKSINERRAVRNVAILFGVLVFAVLAVGVLYTQMVLVPKVGQMELDASNAKALETVVVGIEDDCKKLKDTMIPPVKQKLDFITSVLDYNKKYPRLYEEVAKWTYDKVAYTGLTCDGTQMAMSARAKNLDDLGRFLLNMYRATDLFTEVTISGVPGYGAAGSQTGLGGAPQMMGMEMPGAMPPMPGMGMPGGSFGANMSGMGAITVGTIRGAAPSYIEFGVNCKLKTPIVAPTFASAAAAGAAGTPGAPAAPPAMPAAGPMPPAQ